MTRLSFKALCAAAALAIALPVAVTSDALAQGHHGGGGAFRGGGIGGGAFRGGGIGGGGFARGGFAAVPRAGGFSTVPQVNRGFAGGQFAANRWGGGRWGGGRWHHGRGWYGPGLGFAAGLAAGSALAWPYYDDYYYDTYAYAPDDYYAEAAPGGDSVSYCMQRYRSYDPSSGTYLGYDGLRHPCP